ncbi:MAG: hypothetical protein A2542_01845 [Parcubacteria group bacterium RIFOXYD2_FULL_52_8]|nr:MAG: hypothetical protein A2542_01845 [Parcubacteria group bacterium RIFOXYD2_FULL_52_8]
MQKILAQMERMAPDMSTPMRLTVRYDTTLQKITGCAEESVFMGAGGTFLYLLQNVFMSHPEIQKKYPPGVLGFEVNGFPPKTYSPMFDGDVITFSVNR